MMNRVQFASNGTKKPAAETTAPAEHAKWTIDESTIYVCEPPNQAEVDAEIEAIKANVPAEYQEVAIAGALAKLEPSLVLAVARGNPHPKTGKKHRDLIAVSGRGFGEDRRSEENGLGFADKWLSPGMLTAIKKHAEEVGDFITVNDMDVSE
jgi:hypothetical protein